MRRFLFLYLLLLLFLNLTPRVPSSPVANGDKLAHLFEFAILGFLGWRLWTYMLPLPVLLEFLQLFVPGRTFSFADIGANLIGFTLGLIAGWLHEGSHEGTEVSNEGGD
ncbi:VanZ family protein [Thermococcus sp. MAR1]|uniref:VanZ family protein n=1 Tax=Thermococcus sp. MAR1 TaxID=1638263 RepID=UPI001439EDD4|nr:VanZ family protein [Thermococcus sp. MAR1]NJE11392.1 VanZ family protein [Thermococcus sp. MAR1]